MQTKSVFILISISPPIFGNLSYPHCRLRGAWLMTKSQPGHCSAFFPKHQLTKIDWITRVIKCYPTKCNLDIGKVYLSQSPAPQGFRTMVWLFSRAMEAAQSPTLKTTWPEGDVRQYNYANQTVYALYPLYRQNQFILNSNEYIERVTNGRDAAFAVFENMNILFRLCIIAS